MGGGCDWESSGIAFAANRSHPRPTLIHELRNHCAAWSMHACSLCCRYPPLKNAGVRSEPRLWRAAGNGFARRKFALATSLNRNETWKSQVVMKRSDNVTVIDNARSPPERFPPDVREMQICISKGIKGKILRSPNLTERPVGRHATRRGRRVAVRRAPQTARPHGMQAVATAAVSRREWG